MLKKPLTVIFSFLCRVSPIEKQGFSCDSLQSVAVDRVSEQFFSTQLKF